MLPRTRSESLLLHNETNIDINPSIIDQPQVLKLASCLAEEQANTRDGDILMDTQLIEQAKQILMDIKIVFFSCQNACLATLTHGHCIFFAQLNKAWCRNSGDGTLCIFHRRNLHSCTPRHSYGPLHTGP